MNILVVNDLHLYDEEAREIVREKLSLGTVDGINDARIACNYDQITCIRLKKMGHLVICFDCYQDDLETPILDPIRAAEIICRLIVEFKIERILFDLHYFDDMFYGRAMLEWLESNCPSIKQTRMVVGSRFLRQSAKLTQEELHSDFPFIGECVNRNTGRINEVVAAVLR